MKTNSHITIDPDIMGGRPVFAGTRVPIDGLFEYIESGLTIDEFVSDFPSVTKTMAIQVLEILRKETIET